MPGAVLGIRLADGRTVVVASGQTDDAGGQPVQPGHRFRLGSITKTFVAALVLQLVDEGLVELDAPIGRYLAGAPFADVTVRQLLGQTSGVPDFGAQPEYRERLLADPARVWSAEEVVELVSEQPLRFEPGSRFEYSNTNYTLAGMVAEEVTGHPLAELLHESISEPLGLDATYLEGSQPSPPMAVSGHYDLDGDGTAENVRAVPYTALVTSGAAAGGLSGSAIDVLDFASALFEGNLISDELRAEMLAVTAGGGYGLGVMRFERAGQAAWGHGGALPGFATLFAHLPEASATVVTLANQSNADVEALVRAALVEALTLGR